MPRTPTRPGALRGSAFPVAPAAAPGLSSRLMRALPLLAALAACASSTAPATPTAQTAPTPAPPTGGEAPTPAPTSPAPSVASSTPPPPSGANPGDAPEISRSVGARGGVVILWPRIAPRSDDPAVRAIATAVQQRLRAVVERSLPGRPIDVRPEPERVCPRQGCAAMTVGASLFHTPRGGCTVVAIVSGAGASPQRLVPWVGNVTLREAVVPFREPPEGRMVAEDMAPCASVATELAAHEEAVAAAVREAAPPN